MFRISLAILFLVGCSSSVPAETTKDNTKYVIIHADDAGMSHSVNSGTIDSMVNGIVSSASIMVPCPWFKEYAAHAKNHPEGDYGIHLTLTSEWKNYRWKSVSSSSVVPSLHDEEGYLWDNSGLVAKHVNVKEAEIELRAQIDRALAFGVPLSHLDTHMGSVLATGELFELYVKLGIDYGIPVMFAKNIDPAYQKQLGSNAKRLQKVLEAHNLPVLDYIIQYYYDAPYEARKKRYLDTIRNLKPGVTQIIIHCGYDNEELRSITTSSERRDGDRKVFMDPEVIKAVSEMDVKVITWKQFHEMEKKKAKQK